MKLNEKSYENVDFSREEIEMEDITQIKFTKCTFRWTDFTEVSVIYGCSFDTCDFSNARLNGVNMKNTAFLSCRFAGASFFAVKLENCKMMGSDLMNTDCALLQIEGGDWSYTNLRNLSFQKQDLCGIRFLGADLTGCRFNQCKMNDCEFDEASVHDTSFYKSDIRNSSIASLNLFEINFKQALLDLEQCIAIAEYLTEGKYSPEQEKS